MSSIHKELSNFHQLGARQSYSSAQLETLVSELEADLTVIYARTRSMLTNTHVEGGQRTAHLIAAEYAQGALQKAMLNVVKDANLNDAERNRLTRFILDQRPGMQLKLLNNPSLNHYLNGLFRRQGIYIQHTGEIAATSHGDLYFPAFRIYKETQRKEGPFPAPLIAFLAKDLPIPTFYQQKDNLMEVNLAVRSNFSLGNRPNEKLAQVDPYSERTILYFDENITRHHAKLPEAAEMMWEELRHHEMLHLLHSHACQEVRVGSPAHQDGLIKRDLDEAQAVLGSLAYAIHARPKFRGFSMITASHLAEEPEYRYADKIHFAPLRNKMAYRYLGNLVGTKSGMPEFNKLPQPFEVASGTADSERHIGDVLLNGVQTRIKLPAKLPKMFAADLYALASQQELQVSIRNSIEKIAQLEASSCAPRPP